MSISISAASRAAPDFYLSINGRNIAAEKEKQDKENSKEMSYEEKQIEDFKEENSPEDNRLSQIYGKFRAGKELTAEELKYLAEHSPEIYKEVKEVLMERKAMEAQMKLAKTKEQVAAVRVNQSSNIKATMGKGKQAEKQAVKTMARTNQATDAYNRYTATAEYEKKEDIKSQTEERKERVKSMNTNAVAGNVADTAAYSEVKKTKVTSGKTIGSPELSENAQKYYEELQNKFSNMDFILVSPDKKAEAEANAGAYASPNRTVVLIDTEKIEKMAEDENYRKQYEGIISNAANQLTQMQSSLGTTSANVKTYGIKINDGGTASFFAVIDKSLEDQKDRIEKKAEKKAEDKKQQTEKAAEKRAEKRKEQQKRLEEDKDTVTITASSIEELTQKINDYVFMEKSNYVETDQEKKLGRSIDFAV